jgi:putative transposase
VGEFRRVRLAGATYFFTVALLDRGSGLLVEHIELLRLAVRKAKAARPFHIDAWVVLPDHMHCVWILPQGDGDYSTRWKNIKAEFSRSLEETEYRSPVRVKKGERGIWQRRFWEHTIRGDTDYFSYIDYVHLNPYKHGLVAHVKDWPYSSFHKYVKEGVYPVDWMTEVVDKDCGE